MGYDTASSWVVGNPSFTRITEGLLGLCISYLGDQFTIIALLWFVLQLTGSDTAVGLPSQSR
jgi:hypothetical protein